MANLGFGSDWGDMVGLKKIVGDRTRFAFEIRAEHQQFCTCLLWVDGVRVGDASEPGLRGSLAEGLTWFGSLEPNRNDERLFAMAPRLLLSEDFEGVFGGAGSLSEATDANIAYGRLLLSPNLFPSLDQVVVVVVGSAERRRIVVGTLGGQPLAETTIAATAFAQVLAEVVEFVERDGPPPVPHEGT